jgi:hypothetical protein
MDNKERRSAELVQPRPVSASTVTMRSVPTEQMQAQKAQQKAITQGLRRFFNSVAAEPVPDEFVELLRKLDQDKTAGS